MKDDEVRSLVSDLLVFGISNHNQKVSNNSYSHEGRPSPYYQILSVDIANCWKVRYRGIAREDGWLHHFGNFKAVLESSLKKTEIVFNFNIYFGIGFVRYPLK